jgi:ATP-binding cassette subfamily B protein
VRPGAASDGIEGKAYDARLMRRLLAYVAPYRWQVAAAVLLLLALTPLQLAGPWLIKTAIDRNIRGGDLGGLGWTALLFTGVSGLVLAVRYVQMYLTAWVGQKAMLDLRLAVFTHVQRLPLAYFDRTPVGTLMTRVGSDVEVLHELFSAGVINVFGDAALLSGIVVMMLWLDWRLALVTFSVIPLLVWATLLFRARVRSNFRLIRQKVAALSAHLQETVSGMPVVQLFGLEEENRRRYDRENLDYQQAYLKTIFYYAVFFPAVEVIGSIGLALIIWRGGGLAASGLLTLGALVAFIEYTQRFMSPVQDLAEKYNILQSAMAASERLFVLLDTPPQAEPERAVPIPAPAGRVVLDRVDFAYNPGEPVLRQVSFTVAPGERVAIVGATGAGKTSISSLITRLYEPTGGRIEVDGLDVRQWPLGELRRRVGSIPQEVFLFPGDVIDNILPAGPRDRARAESILDELGARGMFERLPAGLETPLRERAAVLSTGQRQILAFARALAADPPVLLLDEATSAMDGETEERVQGAMRRLLAGRTALIIAHRLSTIRDADRIVVIHKGKIRETGTHRELLELQGIYWRLHRLQYAQAAP